MTRGHGGLGLHHDHHAAGGLKFQAYEKAAPPAPRPLAATADPFAGGQARQCQLLCHRGVAVVLEGYCAFRNTYVRWTYTSLLRKMLQQPWHWAALLHCNFKHEAAVAANPAAMVQPPFCCAVQRPTACLALLSWGWGHRQRRSPRPSPHQHSQVTARRRQLPPRRTPQLAPLLWRSLQGRS